MNKSKKELYEENKKLRKTIKTYSEFWETEAIEECTKQNKFIKKSLYIASVVLLIISAFLIGLGW
jgi:hypothetical protein